MPATNTAAMPRLVPSLITCTPSRHRSTPSRAVTEPNSAAAILTKVLAWTMAAGEDVGMAVTDPNLVSYLLRTVRVGINATWFVVAGLAFYLVMGSSDAIDRGLFLIVLVAALGGAALIALLPWERLFQTPLGMPALYVWSVLDIVLITLLIHASGGERSVVFVMYALTTVFFSASYPQPAKIALLVFTLVAYLVASALGDWGVDLAGVLLRFSILASLTYIVGFLSRELIQRNALLADQVEEHSKTAAQLAETQRLARLGSWRWKPTTGELVVSEEVVDIYGLRDRPANPGFLIDLSHPEDREMVSVALEKARSRGSSFIFEHRIVRPDGSPRHVLAQGRVEGDAYDRLIIGTALDVTERKRAEEYDAQLRQLAVKKQQALQINDNLVQGLTVAKYAVEMGRLDIAQNAVDATLKAARSIVAELLAETGDIEPGSLIRTEAAFVGEEERP